MVDFSTSIDIAAPPEVVFAHLVDAERMVAWMGERADLQPVPGGRFAVDVNGVPFRGEYLEVDPPRRVVVSWGMAGSADLPPGSSRVEFTLTATPGGTALRLNHSGLPDTRAQTHGLGWAHYLYRLRVAAAGGDPGTDHWRPGINVTEDRPPMAIDRTTDVDVIEAYYATWRSGIASFDEAGLRGMLAADFVYEGPIAGRRPGVESFVPGLKAFVQTLKAMRMIAQLRNGSEAAFLYDCDVSQPAGTFRFAEFLRVGNGQIHEIKLVFDATEFRKAAAATS